MRTLEFRTILCAIIVFCGIAGGFSIWYHHEMSKLDAEDKAFYQRLEQWEAARIHAPTVTTDVATDATGSALPIENRVHAGDTPDVLPVTTDIGIPEDTVSDETQLFSEIPRETVEDIPVSPHGFGPYPELPEGWGPETWNNLSANHELMKRVRIKLLSQGVNAVGTTMEDGLVYPTIKGVAYVKWKSYLRPTGIVRYISDFIGHPDDGVRVDAIISEKGCSFTEADIPSDIELVPLEEGGIDPYAFLDLPRR